MLLTSCGLFNSNGNGNERYFEFTHQDNEVDYSFTAKTSDPEVISRVEDQLDMPFGQRNILMAILNGEMKIIILIGTGILCLGNGISSRYL